MDLYSHAFLITILILYNGFTVEYFKQVQKIPEIIDLV
jgi:hypothetical protein